MTRFQTLLFTLAVCGLGLASEHSFAQDQEPAEQVFVKYDFNFGGFNMGGAELTTDFTDTAYAASSKLRTGGLAEAFFKSRYTTSVVGKREDKSIRPVRYDSEFKGVKGKYQLLTIEYRPDTWPMLTRADPPYDKKIKKRPVAEKLKWRTMDPLSAWIHMIAGVTADEKQPCGRKVPIFDGVRRYNLELSYEKDDPDFRLGPSWGKALYEGKAYVCKMIYRRIAGFKNKGRESDELPIPPLELWVAPIGKSGYLVPLRVIAHSEYGDVVLIARKIKVKDRQRPILKVEASCGDPAKGPKTELCGGAAPTPASR